MVYESTRGETLRMYLSATESRAQRRGTPVATVGNTLGKYNLEIGWTTFEGRVPQKLMRVDQSEQKGIHWTWLRKRQS